MDNFKSILLVFCIHVILFPRIGVAQSQNVLDSLMKVVNGSNEDTIKIEALLDLGNLYIYNLPDTALFYYEKALEISEQIESFRLQANSRRNIGMVREKQGM